MIGTGCPVAEFDSPSMRIPTAFPTMTFPPSIVTIVPAVPAPLLITAEAVRNMQPGSVIMDLAAETGGNCELTEAGRTVVENGVKVIGPRNLPSEMPIPASQLYAKNLENLLGLPVLGVVPRVEELDRSRRRRPVVGGAPGLPESRDQGLLHRLKVESPLGLEFRLGTGGFVRVNRSTIVNVDQIREIILTPQDEGVVVLRDGTRFPLSRNPHPPSDSDVYLPTTEKVVATAPPQAPRPNVIPWTTSSDSSGGRVTRYVTHRIRCLQSGV